jgi:hypothetical protein
MNPPVASAGADPQRAKTDHSRQRQVFSGVSRRGGVRRFFLRKSGWRPLVSAHRMSWDGSALVRLSQARLHVRATLNLQTWYFYDMKTRTALASEKFAAFKKVVRQLTHASRAVIGQWANAYFHRRFACTSGRDDIGSCLFSLVLLLGLGACAFDVYTVASQIWQTSDSVHSFLEAQSILHGNFLLSGRHLSIDNFIFTDASFFVAYEWLFGARPQALVVVPSIIYVLIVGACLAASFSSLRPSRRNVVAFATVVLLVGLPAARAPSPDPADPIKPILLADFHAASILFSLVALILIAALAPAGRIRDRPLAASVLALICAGAVASDPFTVVFAFGPAVLVLIGDAVLSGGNRNDVSLAAIVVASSVIGRITPALFHQLGGFTTDPTVTFAIVGPENLGKARRPAPSDRLSSGRCAGVSRSELCSQLSF